jgi:uncharacterized protein (DUF488 family)
MSRTIYTIGHSNHTIDRFIELLRAAGVEMVVDVRSQPFSRYSPHFNSSLLAADLRTAGVDYLLRGDVLGGRPSDPAFYDAQGYVLYSEIARRPDFLRAVAEAEGLAEGRRVALMCSEEDPVVCHRKLLLARVLRSRGACVLHLRGDGSVTPDEELDAPQLGLFEEEEMEWKSLRSVSPSGTPPTSSKP